MELEQLWGFLSGMLLEFFSGYTPLFYLVGGLSFLGIIIAKQLKIAS